jgi:fructose-1,6-bisphosphatase/inositol monophosphatase family enzyme
MGFIYAPAIDELYWAIKDKGTYKSGERIFNNSKREELIGSCSRFHSNTETMSFLSKTTFFKLINLALH